MRFTCTTCGGQAMAVRPGTEALVCAGVTVRRAVPDAAWCTVCWLRQFGARQPDLFGWVL